MSQRFDGSILSHVFALARVLAMGAVLAAASLAGATDRDWEAIPGVATDLGVGADGTVWAIGNDARSGGFGIYRWRDRHWENVPGGALRVAVGPKGEAWIANDSGLIFEWTGRSFRRVDGLATDIAVGAGGQVWCIGADQQQEGYGIYRRERNAWTRVPGAAVRIAVDPAGNPWVVNSSGVIYRWTNEWERVAGSAKDIAIGADGTVYILGTERADGGYAIHKWNARRGSWQPHARGAVGLAVAPNGRPWLADSQGRIFRLRERAARPGGGHHAIPGGQYCTDQPPTQCTCVWDRCQLEIQHGAPVTLRRGDARPIAARHSDGFYLRWKRGRDAFARPSEGWSCKP